MALRFRRSKKLFSGVRLNVSSKSLGLSFGGKGFRHSISTSGRRTTSVGIPGTGISYVKTEGGGRKTDPGQPLSRARETASPAPAEVKPLPQRSPGQLKFVKYFGFTMGFIMLLLGLFFLTVSISAGITFLVFGFIFLMAGNLGKTMLKEQQARQGQLDK